MRTKNTSGQTNYRYLSENSAQASGLPPVPQAFLLPGWPSAGSWALASSCSPVKCWHPELHPAPSPLLTPLTLPERGRSSSVTSAPQTPKFLSPFHLYHSKWHHQPPIHESKSQRVSLGTSQPLLSCLLAHSLPAAGSGFLQAEGACKQEGGREPNCIYINPSPHLTHSLFILQKPG